MLKKQMQTNNITMIFIANLIFLIVFFLTFDSYSLGMVTPETPFIKIGEMPFARNQFIVLFGSIAGVVGILAGSLLRQFYTKIIPFTTAVIGAIVLLIVFFDVDTMQSLVPTMRISHVIMTVSRLNAIMLVVSGLFIGLNFSYLFRAEIAYDYKVIFIALLVSIFSSMLLISTGTYLLGYLVVGAFLFVSAIIGQYNRNDLVVTIPPEKTLPITLVKNFFNVGAFVTLVMTMESYIINTLNYDYITYVLILSISLISFMCGKNMKTSLLWKMFFMVIIIFSFILSINAIIVQSVIIIMCFIGSNQNKGKNNYITMLDSGLSIVIFTFISCLLVQKNSEIITYSANRIVYCVNSSVFLFIGNMLIVAIILKEIESRIMKIKGQI